MSNIFLDQFRSVLPKEKFDDVFEQLEKVYPDGEDPWGLNLTSSRRILELLYPVYKQYFRLRIFGKENVQDRPYMIVANHSGQIALDGMLISMAFALDVQPPRILRAMVERFFPALPFFGTWAAEAGAVLGDRQNCLNLLERGESVLVFPEGVNGVAKSTSNYYKLQHFTKGFLRMAIQAEIDILPLSVVGAEEIFPWVYQAKGVAKTLGLPALPISPLYFPLPSPIDIHIGTPYKIPKDLSPDAPDKDLDIHIKAIKKQITAMTLEGLKVRRKFLGNVKGPK
jgi:1-acyl-sn-glycerol-3-phosphate acyltransferase